MPERSCPDQHHHDTSRVVCFIEIRSVDFGTIARVEYLDLPSSPPQANVILATTGNRLNKG